MIVFLKFDKTQNRSTIWVRGMKRMYKSASSLMAALKLSCKVSENCNRATTANASFGRNGEALRTSRMADLTRLRSTPVKSKLQEPCFCISTAAFVSSRSLKLSWYVWLIDHNWVCSQKAQSNNYNKNSIN